jgi:putative PIN family toxin of toxin-antitoxin system
LRVVLDTDVVVAAMRSPRGASAELIRRIDAGRATMVLSVALALEYEATCLRAEHRLEASLSEVEVRDFVDGLIALAEPVRQHFRWRPQVHDPGDELVLEAAVNGQASAIVTFNVKDMQTAERSFGIAVIRPGEALKRIQL